jgi:biotin carboxyl carrier protein
MAYAQADTLQLETLTGVKDSRHLILSPAVGYYSARPKPGTFLTGGSFIGRIRVLNTFYDLHLPGDVFGRVVVEEKDLLLPVEYGEELFRLIPDKNFVESGKESIVPGAGGEDIDASESGYVITAFTTGIFYAKPSPDAPPFVTEGQVIEKGKAIGLIEVMKTFNHIIFHGTDKSDTGKIKKILVKDAQEVKNGQPLFIIE